MTVPLVQVDAFADRPFSGNPAAVCILPEPGDAAWMGRVAQEMNLSETAFLSPHQDGYTLRWFTPAVEVDLCGHATLASAHVLWEMGYLAPDAPARFHTRSGLLTARRDGPWIELDFPATPPTEAPLPPGVAEALGCTPRYTGKSRFDYLIELDGEEAVRALRPDIGRLRSLDLRGVIVTARAASGAHDFVSRFFAPGAGIDEDPVTGSAHCALGPFWSARLGKHEMLAYQASPRGGVLRVRFSPPRVFLGGQAITVLRGELLA
jgi:predicted PhzF superfamily epimerase YddE/YHI9